VQEVEVQLKAGRGTCRNCPRVPTEPCEGSADGRSPWSPAGGALMRCKPL